MNETPETVTSEQLLAEIQVVGKLVKRLSLIVEIVIVLGIIAGCATFVLNL